MRRNLFHLLMRIRSVELPFSQGATLRFDAHLDFHEATTHFALACGAKEFFAVHTNGPAF